MEKSAKIHFIVHENNSCLKIPFMQMSTFQFLVTTCQSNECYVNLPCTDLT